MATFKGYSSLAGEFSEPALFDKDLARRDLLNHFYTRRGERLMAPLYGSTIWDILFEPMTEDNQEIIFSDAQRIVGQDPRWKLKEAQLRSDTNGQAIYLDMLLTYVPTTSEETLTVAFETNTKGNNP
jgi:phage baseplate assembly protein W